MLHGDSAAKRILSHQTAGGSFRDQSAAFLDKFRQLLQPLEAHASADIIALIHPSQIGSLFALLIRKRHHAGAGDPSDHRLRSASYMWKYDHVIAGAQAALTKFLIGEVSIGHAVMIQ